MIWSELMLIDLRSYSLVVFTVMLTDWRSRMGNRFTLENAKLLESRICLNSPKRYANLTSKSNCGGIPLTVDRTGRLQFRDGSCVRTGAGRQAHHSQFT